MEVSTYRKAQEIANNATICKEVIKFVDKYMPPAGMGYNFKIVLHDREFDCPDWLYWGIRDICDKKRSELKKQFEEL